MEREPKTDPCPAPSGPTPAQLEALELYERLGNWEDVARELGISEPGARRRGSEGRRRMKPEGEDPSGYALTPLTRGHSLRHVKVHRDANGRVKQTWALESADADRREAFLQAVSDVASEHSGKFERAPMPRYTNEDMCSLILWGDPHAGLLASAAETGKAYDLTQWESDIVRATKMLIQRAPESKECVLANLGDMAHSNNAQNVTPKSKHPLDVSHRWCDVYKSIMRAQRKCIDAARMKFERVTIVNVRGNHDPEIAPAISMAWEMLYENCPEVVISDPAAWFHYKRFGRCLWGFTHGDGVKDDRLVGSMLEDQREYISRAEHLKWFLGHIHHSDRKELSGGVVREHYSTLSPRDSYAHQAGFRSERAMYSEKWHRVCGYRGNDIVTARDLELEAA